MGYGQQNEDADDDRQRALEAHLKKSGLGGDLDKESESSSVPKPATPATHYGRFSRPQGVASSAPASSAPAPTPVSRFARTSQPASVAHITPRSPSAGVSAPSAPSAPSARPSQVASAPIQSSQQQPIQPPAPQDAVSTSSANPPAPKPKSFRQFSYADDEVTVVNNGPSAFQLKGLRARRLVQEVADFKKWDAVETERMEREAVRDPDKMIAQLQPIYQQEIRPFRTKGIHTLEEGVQKHPEDVVFLLRKKDQQRLRVVSREQAGGEALLHKATLESIPSELCPFDKPSTWVTPPSPTTPASPKP